MQFSEVPPLRQSTRTEQVAIKVQANKLNLSEEQLSAIRGVVSWGLLLTTCDRPRHELVRNFMHMVGGTVGCSRLINRARQDDCSRIKPVVQRLLEDIGRGTCDPGWLTDTPRDGVCRIYTELTASQAKLLQVIVKHRLRLDQLDLTQISKMVPFPLDEGSYLWRFIAGGAQSPRHAVNHLTESVPFLVSMKNLIEGLSKPPYNMIELRIDNEPWDSDMSEPGDKMHAVLGVINSSQDFYGPHLGREKVRLKTIFIPRLPSLEYRYVPKSDHPELARALYGWLLFGDIRPEILWRTALSPGQEQMLIKWQKQVDHFNEQRAQLQERLAGTTEDTLASEEVKSALDKVDRKLKSRERSISEVEDERSQIVPIGKQLEAFAKSNRVLRGFRRELEKTVSAGIRPVLCFVGYDETKGHGVQAWVNLLDDAIAPPPRVRYDPDREKVSKLLRGASFLFSQAAGANLRDSWKSRGDSVSRLHYRRFDVEESVCNPSVHAVLSGVVSLRTPPELGDLLWTVRDEKMIPGVSSQVCLRSLVQKGLKKQRLGPSDYFSYVCSSATNISAGAMLTMLESLHGLGVSKLPAEIVDICEARFGLPRRLFDSYHEYTARYRPERFGSPGNYFTDSTSFGAFLAGGLDTIGMVSELERLQRALCNSQVVAIVDSTGYYPHLQSAPTWTPIMTQEVWGEYVPPSMRLVRSLASRIMRGQVEPILQQSSVLVPVSPDPNQALQQKMLSLLFGFEVRDGADRKELNKIVAEIAQYNEKAIVVLDATQVQNIDDYKRLLATLESFQLKTILCTRKQFPVEQTVFVDSFSREGLVDRILAEPTLLKQRLELTRPLSRELVDLAVEQVKNSAPQGADPLHLSLQVLSFAATHAKTLGENGIVRQDLVEATSKIFNLPSPEQMSRYIDGVRSFEREALLATLGQETAIGEVASSMRQHLLKLRPERSPLVMMLAGPTGTGKTMLGELLAKNLNLPLEMIQGSQYTSYHQISRLVGSPADYRGPDEGKLFKFVAENPAGIVFIDEFEKMEQSFLPYLMNFLDIGTLESGDGKVVHRPGLTIILASNAGADLLHRGMTTRMVKDVIGNALAHDPEKRMDWLVARMQVIPVLALDLPAFKEAIRKSLYAIGARKGVWSANLELAGVDDSACELLFKATRDVCKFEARGRHGGDSFGFHTVSDGSGSADDLFIDMRHVERAATQLIGLSLEELVQKQYETGRHRDRTKVWQFRLVGDEAKGEIRAELMQ